MLVTDFSFFLIPIYILWGDFATFWGDFATFWGDFGSLWGDLEIVNRVSILCPTPPFSTPLN